MNKYFIPKAELAALLENANQGHQSKNDARVKLWFTLADKVLTNWDGTYSFLNSLTLGQSAVVCSAQFYRGAEYDFLTSITQSELPSLTLKAFETLHALEYLELLRKLEEVFPGIPVSRMAPK